MTRLATLSLALAILTACDEGGPTTPVPEENPAGAVQAGGLPFTGLSVPAPALGVTHTFTGGGTGSAINDFSTTVATVDVAESATLLDVNVALRLEHTFMADLTVRLTSPSGTEVVLTDQNGGSGDGYVDTYFDDEAADPVVGGSAPFTGPHRPQEPLSAFDGEDQQGTWTLAIYDGVSGDTGTLMSWSLDLEVDGPPGEGEEEEVPAGTLVIGEIDTGVPDDGTFAAAVQSCAADARNHGQFVSCVTRHARIWRKDGRISGVQQGAITGAAAAAALP
jgi:subtilisin-like proprotein convertase family protein